MFEAKVIADSLNPHGVRLTTLQLCYPRFIHSELMTHRVFSRNASSSRAIPISKFIKEVRDIPAMPIHWGKNQPGMQAREECNTPVVLPRWSPNDPVIAVPPQDAWRFAANIVSDIAEAFMDAGYHKQVVNRLLETFQWIRVIVSSTEWDNFFELRNHPDAQPEIQLLSQIMLEALGAIENSTARQLKPGHHHLPYVLGSEWAQYDIEILKKISTARCARVSYLTHDGKEPNIEKDIKLHDDLVNSVPIHASPTEHVAVAADDCDFHKNFRGFVQYREEVEQKVWSGAIINKK